MKNCYVSRRHVMPYSVAPVCPPYFWPHHHQPSWEGNFINVYYKIKHFYEFHKIKLSPELRLQESPVGGKPLVGNLLVLALPREEVEEVNHDT